MLTEQTQQSDKIILKYRKQLHNALQIRMNQWGWLVNDVTTENVKRAFLWMFYKVETSKALTVDKLLDAKVTASILSESMIVDHLKLKDDQFHISNYRRLSDKQLKRILRIALYVIKMDKVKFAGYIKETINRAADVRAISVNEANQLIQRLEKWEAKILLKK